MYGREDVLQMIKNGMVENPGVEGLRCLLMQKEKEETKDDDKRGKSKK